MIYSSCRLRNCRYLRELLAHQLLKVKVFFTAGRMQKSLENMNVPVIFQTCKQCLDAFLKLSSHSYHYSLLGHWPKNLWSMTSMLILVEGCQIGYWHNSCADRLKSGPWRIFCLMSYSFYTTTIEYIHSCLVSQRFPVPKKKIYIYIKNEDPPASACKNHVISL